jgi:hypothetical protein
MDAFRHIRMGLSSIGDSGFSATALNTRAGQPMSIPPPGPDYAQWGVPRSLKDDVRFANKAIPARKGTVWSWTGSEYVGEHNKPAPWRPSTITTDSVSSEALTSSEDFIILPHTACENLYIATCGSFHGWRFFPVLGKYVVEMLDDMLDPALQKKWPGIESCPLRSTMP